MKRSSVVGLMLAALLLAVSGTTAVPSASARVAAAQGSAYSCVIEPFGQSASGRITFRRVVNSRVVVSKTTRARVAWRPIGWGPVMFNGTPGHETTHQIVASTDGRIRLVETEWATRSNLKVRVLKVLGKGYPTRLVTFADASLYWIDADGSLARATWNGDRLGRPKTLPVTITGATTLGAQMTNHGMRVYYTDKAGALHVVTDDGARSTDTIIESSGFKTVTGLKAGPCLSPNHARLRPYAGLLTVDRTTGKGRFLRVLRPGAADGGATTKPVRVHPSDWTWRRLG